MIEQAFLCIKPLLTDATRIGLLACVRCHVGAQPGFFTKVFLANTAAVGPLPGIHSQLNGQRSFRVIQLLTELAGRKLSSRLGPLAVIGTLPQAARAGSRLLLRSLKCVLCITSWSGGSPAGSSGPSTVDFRDSKFS